MSACIYMNAKGADRHCAAYGHISSLAASQGQGIWSQRGHSLCQRHIPRIAPVQAVAMRHDRQWNSFRSLVHFSLFEWSGRRPPMRLQTQRFTRLHLFSMWFVVNPFELTISPAEWFSPEFENARREHEAIILYIVYIIFYIIYFI